MMTKSRLGGGDGAPRSRAAKRRKLLAQREEEDAADWASICAQESEEEKGEADADPDGGA